MSSGGIKNDKKLIKDQGFCQTGKLYYTIVLNYNKMDKNLKSYARCRDPPHTHHNFLANCIN